MDVQVVKDKFKDRLTVLENTLEEIERCSRRILGINYESTADKLVAVMERVNKIKGAVSRHKMRVVFFGKTSNGKSTVINALLGSQVCPTGYGSVTGCFCSVEKGPVGDTGAFQVFDISTDVDLGIDDFVNVETVQSLEKSASFFGSELVSPSSLICVQWPEEKCPLLKDDIAIIDTPGIDAEAMVDEYIVRMCSDADVFVYVCDGKRTIENKEMEFLVQVRNVLSNLTRDNLFIVVNWWDMVCSEGNASAVKAQHIAKAKKFLTREFAFEEDSVEERIFFISAKEALATAQAAASNLVGASKERWETFSKFKEDLKTCLTVNGLQTRFGRHCDSIQLSLGDITTFLDQMVRMLLDKRRSIVGELDDLESRKALLNEGMSDLDHQCSDDQTAGAILKKVEEMVDAAISDAKKKVKRKVEQCNKTYKFGGLEEFKKAVLVDVQRSYDDINRDLERELAQIYQKAENELTSVFNKCLPKQGTVRRRHAGEHTSGTHRQRDMDSGANKLKDDSLPWLKIPEFTVSSLWSSAKQFAPQNKVDAAGGVISSVGLGALATAVATPFGWGAVTGYCAYKVYRLAMTDDLKEEVKSQITSQLCGQLDERAKLMKRDFGAGVMDRLKSQSNSFHSKLGDHLQMLECQFVEKEADIRQNDEDRVKLEELKQKIREAGDGFAQFRDQCLTVHHTETDDDFTTAFHF